MMVAAPDEKPYPDPHVAGIVSGIARREREAVKASVLAGELSPSEAADIPVMRSCRASWMLRQFPHPAGTDPCDLLREVGIEKPETARVRRLGSRQSAHVMSRVDGWWRAYIAQRELIYSRMRDHEVAIEDALDMPGVADARAQVFLVRECRLGATRVERYLADRYEGDASLARVRDMVATRGARREFIEFAISRGEVGTLAVPSARRGAKAGVGL